MSKENMNNAPTKKEGGESIAAIKSVDTDVSGRPIGGGSIVEIKSVDTDVSGRPFISTQLLPGIPDDVTLNSITTKLSWSDLQTLSTASRGWRQALHSREIYDARVRSGSTETLVILDHTHSPHNDVDVYSMNGKTHAISLYSITEGTFYHLPPIPGLRRGIPALCAWASLDGKFYVLGGAKESTLHIGTSQVYMLDLAGEMKWKRCANLLEERLSFSAAVLNGKIYAIAGISPLMNGYICEVYDPKVNAWSYIEKKSTNSELPRNLSHYVTPVGEELFVRRGICYDSDIYLSMVMVKPEYPVQYGPPKCTEDKCYCIYDRRFSYWIESAYPSSLEAYHPGDYELRWRAYRRRDYELRWITGEESWEGLGQGSVIFTAQGKLYSLGQKGICVHGAIYNQSEVTILYPWNGNLSGPYYRNAKIGTGDDVRVEPIAAIVAGDDLLVTANWYCNSGDKRGSCLLRGRGFGSDKKEIYWEIARCCLLSTEASSCFGHNPSALWLFGRASPIMCTIQL